MKYRIIVTNASANKDIGCWNSQLLRERILKTEILSCFQEFKMMNISK